MESDVVASSGLCDQCGNFGREPRHRASIFVKSKGRHFCSCCYPLKSPSASPQECVRMSETPEERRAHRISRGDFPRTRTGEVLDLVVSVPVLDGELRETVIHRLYEIACKEEMEARTEGHRQRAYWARRS